MSSFHCLLWDCLLPDPGNNLHWPMAKNVLQAVMLYPKSQSFDFFPFIYLFMDYMSELFMLILAGVASLSFIIRNSVLCDRCCDSC